MAESLKSKASASCPTTSSKKSTTPPPIPLLDVSTPATFYMDSPLEIQEYLSRAREGLRKDNRMSEKKPWYFAKPFRPARKVDTFEDTQKKDPSNATCIVLYTKQNTSLVTSSTSEHASMVVSIDQGHVIAAESEVQFSTIEQIAPAPSKLDGVTYDQVQPVESMSNQDGAGAIHADELPLVHTSTSHNGDTNDPNPRPKSPRGADETPATDLSRVPEPYTPPVPIPRKLRHSSSYPALNATHPSRSVSNSTLVDSWPLSLAIPPLSPPTTIKETGAQDGAEASHHSRASSSGNLEIRHLSRPYRLSDVDRNRVAGAIQKLKCAVDNDWAEHLAKAIANAKVAKDEEWTVRLEQAVGQAKAAKDDERTKRLEEAVGHAKTAKDTEWTECLEKAVAQAEAIKDEELEAFARIKESNHENDMEDLKEDHEHQIQELEESHVEALQKLTTKHEEELLTLARKHAAEARKLELRRTQGVKELTRLKQELSEVEAEKMTMEKDLTHMTGQRDALHKAFVAMTGQHPSQVTTAPVDTPHIEQDLLQHPEEAEDTHETPDQESTPTTPTKANMFKRTAIPATTSTPLTPHPPHPPPQPTYHTIVPPSHYPRIQILETENAHLRTSLEQRHKDVTYANHKSDNLRALLEADPDKSSTYADILIHKETIHDLESRLQESWEAVEREKLESERLREKIDLLVEEVKKEEVGRNVAVKDRETAWMRNENLLRELKGVFKRSDFDIAFWTHYEALVKEKEGLEGDIEGYKRERHALMEEAIDTKAKMRQLELEHAVAASEAADEASEEGGVQDLKNQLLTRQIENEAMRAEISFLTAEVENRKVAPEMPQALKDVSQMVLDEKNRVIEELRSRLRGGGGGRKGYRGGGREEYGDGDVEDRGVEGRGGCGDTPRSDTSFF